MSSPMWEFLPVQCCDKLMDVVIQDNVITCFNIAPGDTKPGATLAYLRHGDDFIPIEFCPFCGGRIEFL